MEIYSSNHVCEPFLESYIQLQHYYHELLTSVTVSTFRIDHRASIWSACLLTSELGVSYVFNYRPN